MVCGFAFAFVACGGGKNEEADNADSVATEAPAAADTTASDTTAADTTAQ